MKKKLALIIALVIFAGSSFSAFADELKDLENTVLEEVQELEEVIEEMIKIEEETEELKESPRKKEVILQLDSTLAWVDGEEYTLTARPKVIQGRTYLPLRFMGDKLLESRVDWDNIQKKVTILKDNKKVEIEIDKKIAHINGDQILIENTAIIVDSITYLPLRTTAELFDIQTDYDESTRQIKLVKLEEDSYKPPVLKKPIAQFSFAQGDYIAGQPVKALDESFHEQGRPITDQLWMINMDETKTNKKLENMFSKPNPGKYLVSLKVEAGKGNWSEWTSKEITIKPNEKPVVTTLEPSKSIYAGGEPMDFTYTYENESWEGIKATRWTYRQAGEVLSKAVVEKPEYIFYQGKYIVTLQLQDDYGNWSDTKETIVEISRESLQSEYEYRFTKGKPGDTIDNFKNFNYVNYKEVPANQTSFGGGTLYLSNSPENVKANGILYKDTVKGEGRLMLHHHNVFTVEENEQEAKKIVLLAENKTDETVVFTLSNRAERGPSADILFVGKQVIYDHLKGSPAITYALAPGEKMFIYDSGAKRWDKGQVVSVQMDFNVTGQLTLTTVAAPRDAKIEDISDLPELARDVHPRGTFDHTDIYHKVTVDNNEPTKLVLGTGNEEWTNGYDAISGQIVQNRGGFAFTYKIEITATEDTGIMLNPRAGLFSGALKWDDEEPFYAPSKGYFMGHNSKAVMLGVVKAGETRTLEYSLPNGSASPVLLVFMPESAWN